MRPAQEHPSMKEPMGQATIISQDRHKVFQSDSSDITCLIKPGQSTSMPKSSVQSTKVVKRSLKIEAQTNDNVSTLSNKLSEHFQEYAYTPIDNAYGLTVRKVDKRASNVSQNLINTGSVKGFIPEQNAQATNIASTKNYIVKAPIAYAVAEQTAKAPAQQLDQARRVRDNDGQGEVPHVQKQKSQFDLELTELLNREAYCAVSDTEQHKISISSNEHTNYDSS